MFLRKYGILFFSKNTFEWRVTDRDGTALSHRSSGYTMDTLSDALTEAVGSWRGNIRLVLGEELVYVTDISFSETEKISRESVLERATQLIPEDLKRANWDFERLHTVPWIKSGNSNHTQVVAVEKTFSESLQSALKRNNIFVESIIPESYALSLLETDVPGVTVIARQRCGMALWCAIEDGLVLTTRIEDGLVTVDRTRAFLSFLATHKGKKSTRILLASDVPDEIVSQHGVLSGEGYTILPKDIDVFIPASKL